MEKTNKQTNYETVETRVPLDERVVVKRIKNKRREIKKCDARPGAI